MDPTHRCPVPGRSIASRLVAGRALILDPAADQLQRLNDVGSFVWARILEGGYDVGRLTDAVVASFEVEPADAEADLVAFLDELAARGYIEWRGPDGSTLPTQKRGAGSGEGDDLP
ncbi:MAG: PqqD family protein [Myxococcales bacterium]|nr:PqqD family protein [Myxococcales bacterium]MCB9534637.1 PqqD family protein [Myxococcales bacterium]